jgi:signal transduction histidine kinase
MADRALLSVTNTGPSIPVDQMEAIFQLFRRSDKARANRAADGWGIGLPYVRSVAERHAGSIGVESSERSTRFFLDMPRDPVPILASVNKPTISN